MRTTLPPEIEPVAIVRALLHEDGALAVGHALEHAFGGGSADDGDAAFGVAADQLIEHAAGQHGVADPIAGDEQDAHGAVILQQRLMGHPARGKRRAI